MFRLTSVVDVADDGCEVAIADPDLAAARVEKEAVLGLVEILERVAAKRPDECLARALHRVLGVDGFEEQADGAVLGTGAVALLLADGAAQVGILALEGMAEVTPPGSVDAQEGRDEQGGGVACED